MSDVTVLTIVRDAEETLEQCLSSVDWADRIFVVIDPRTKDESRDIARRHTDWVVEHEFFNPGHQRNWALPQIETEWTLVLDSDEWVLPELAERVRSEIDSNPECHGFEIRRQTYFFGKLIKHGGWDKDYNLRLFRTGKGRYNQDRSHEKVIVEGPVGVIHERMMHDTYRNWDEYMIALDRYSTWGAEDRFEKGRRFRLTDLTVRPWLRFFRMYVLRLGFLDGRHGFILAGLTAFAVFLKYAKLWNLDRLRREGKPVELSRNH